jgi:hypothetical protein
MRSQASNKRPLYVDGADVRSKCEKMAYLLSERHGSRTAITKNLGPTEVPAASNNLIGRYRERLVIM